jgi:glycosyltransferase involved in cell wall biosynthesis
METLTIGIPVYNEIKHIEKTISNIVSVSKEVNFQIEL